MPIDSSDGPKDNLKSSIEKAIVSDNANMLDNQGNTSQDVDNILLKLSLLTQELEAIKAGSNSFNITQDEKMFYERKVRPLLDVIYFLSLSSNSIATTAQLMQGNTYGRKHEIRQALNLSHEVNKEIEEVFEVFKRRSKVFRSGIDEALDNSCRE